MNIDKIPAGLAMDVLIAEEVLGWYASHMFATSRYWDPAKHDPIHYSCDEPDELLHWSTDDTVALQIAKLLAEDNNVLLEPFSKQGALVWVGDHATKASTLALAICRAALRKKLVRPTGSIRQANLARLMRQFKPVNIEELLSLLSVAKEQNGNLAVYVDGEPLTEGHIRIVHLLDRSIEKQLASAGLAELFGYDPNQPDVYLEIN